MTEEDVEHGNCLAKSCPYCVRNSLLETMCEACSVFAIHYKYMAEVLEKNIRSTEFIDHSFERQFYGACYGLR